MSSRAFENGISADQLVAVYPRLYHMAHAGAWPSIQKHGLRSTSALLDLYGITGQKRFNYESSHRLESYAIENIVHGSAIIRDQKPMPPKLLERCLTDGTPRKWYEHLNNKVFFWPTEDRLQKMLHTYRHEPRIVLTISTEQLLTHHKKDVAISPINSGAPFPMKPVP
jgi:hypothetical protein